MAPTENARAALVVLGCALLSLLTACGNDGATSAPSPATYTFTAGSPASWIQQFAASNIPPPSLISIPEQLTAIATDPGNNIVVGGYDLGSFNGYPNPLPVAQNFIAKFDRTGSRQWVVAFANGNGDFLQALATDASGNIYATGDTRGAVPGTSNPTRNLQSAVYKFSPAGTLLWESSVVLGNYTEASAISVDPFGTPIIAGSYTATSSATGANLFFRKLDPLSGASIWTSTKGVNASNFFNALTTDAAGDIFATGVTSGAFPGINGGAQQAFLAKLSGQDGATLWTVSPVATPGDLLAPFALAVGSNLIVGGAESSISAFVCVGFCAASPAHAFINSYATSNGASQWSRTFATSAGDEIASVAFTASGNIVASGITNGLFASGFQQPAQNVLLLYLTAGGENISATQFGTGPLIPGSSTAGPLIATDGAGDAVIGAVTQGAYAGFTNPKSDRQLFVASFTRP